MSKLQSNITYRIFCEFEIFDKESKPKTLIEKIANGYVALKSDEEGKWWLSYGSEGFNIQVEADSVIQGSGTEMVLSQTFVIHFTLHDSNLKIIAKQLNNDDFGLFQFRKKLSEIIYKGWEKRLWGDQIPESEEVEEKKEKKNSGNNPKSVVVEKKKKKISRNDPKNEVEGKKMKKSSGINPKKEVEEKKRNENSGNNTKKEIVPIKIEQ